MRQAHRLLRESHHAGKTTRNTEAHNGVFMLVLINTAMFLIGNVFKAPWIVRFHLHHTAPRWWQLLTAAFCHASWQHLSSNSFMLLIFGRIVEEEVFDIDFSRLMMLQVSFVIPRLPYCWYASLEGAFGAGGIHWCRGNLYLLRNWYDRAMLVPRNAVPLKPRSMAKMFGFCSKIGSTIVVFIDIWNAQQVTDPARQVLSNLYLLLFARCQHRHTPPWAGPSGKFGCFRRHIWPLRSCGPLQIEAASQESTGMYNSGAVCDPAGHSGRHRFNLGTIHVLSNVDSEK